MIEDALAYPFESDDGLENLLLGGISILLSLLLFPLFLVFGYQLKIYESTLNGSDEPPTFTDIGFGNLLKGGLAYFAISIGYLLLPLIIFLIGFVLIGFSTSAEAMTGAALLLFAVGFLVYVLIGYLVPAAVLNYVDQGDLGAAFDISTITDAAFTRDYLIAYLITFVIGLVFGLASAIVGIIPFIGWFVTPFISFYITIVTHRILGNGYRKAISSA